MDAANSSPQVTSSAAPQPPVPAPLPVRIWPQCVRSTLFVMMIAAVAGLLTHSLLHGNVQRPVSDSGEAPLTRIDLNAAGRAELRLLPGVGDQLAARIEAYRTLYGPYPNIDELRKVPGIGPLTIERLRPYLVVSAQPRTVDPDQAIAAAPKGPAHLELPRNNKKLEALTELIDVNTASIEELHKLPGIGPKLSQNIINSRSQGLFKTVDDLRRVPGIGPKTLAKLRPLVKVGGADTASP